MKKYFYSMLATATMLFAASCSQDDELTGSGNGEQNVSFTVQVPATTQTRAIADGVEVGKGNMANTLIYALYEQGKEDETPLILGLKTEDQDGVFTITVPMAKDLKYELLLLAYNEGNCAFDINYDENNLASVNLQALKLKSTLSANQEAYDAFVGSETVSVNEEAVTIIKLKRPFAQVNAATTDDDLANAKTLGAVVTTSQLVINGVPTQYNVFTGEATELKDLTYTDASILYQTNTTTNEEITVDGTTYNYLTLAYVLAGETATSDKSTHNATFTFNRADGTTVSTINISNLPIQRNYRTNVVGDLLTKTEAYKVEIDPVFNEPAENIDNIVKVSSALDLQKAIDDATGDTYIEFTQDIDASAFTRAAAGINITQKEGVNLVIAGSGYKFDGVITVNGDGRSTGAETLTFRNINFETTYSDQTKENEWTFIDAPSKIGNKYNYSHNVTIENCTFKNTVTNNWCVGSASFTGTYNLAMSNCTATNMHSLLQVQSCDNNATVNNVKVVNGKNGVSFGNTVNPKISNATIDASAYGIRADGNASRGNLVVENTTINANKPIIVRKVTTGGYSVKLGDNVELNTTAYNHVVFTSGQDDADYVAPTVIYSITGADNYMVYPLQTEADTEITLKTAEQLFWFADQVNESGNSFSGKTVKLGADIDLENAAWTPVGQTGATQFKGTFDGQGYTISNLNINATAQTGGNYSTGIFGWLNAAKVKNVKVAGATVKGNHNVGVIAGYLETSGCTVENCHVSGATVECHVANSEANGDKCGAIVGHAGNSGVVVKDCTAGESTVSAGRDAGQIVGAAKEANVTGCSAENVTVTANGEGTGANIRNEVIGRFL